MFNDRLKVMLKCINIQIYKIAVIIPTRINYAPIAMNICVKNLALPGLYFTK